MDLFPPKKYQTDPLHLLKFINLMKLWTIPSLKNREIAVATTMWTGVMKQPRPMATLYLVGAGYLPDTGRIVLIDETETDDQSGIVHIRFQAYPFHEFDTDMVFAPVTEKTWWQQDAQTLADELREVIASHWEQHKYIRPRMVLDSAT